MLPVRNAARVVCLLLGCRCMKNADIPPRGGGGNTLSRRRGAERGRVSTDDVAHRQDHCNAWRFLVYRASACVVPLPAATVCYTLALLSGPDGRAMCCLQHA